MNQSHKNFIERLQSSDESRKRRWMFGGTVVAMVIVVYVWFAYFNNLVGNFNEPQLAAAPESGFTFLHSIENGMSIISGSFVGEIKNIGGMLRSPKEYIINPLN